jgi:hypothetical protein
MAVSLLPEVMVPNKVEIADSLARTGFETHRMESRSSASMHGSRHLTPTGSDPIGAFLSSNPRVPLRAYPRKSVFSAKFANDYPLERTLIILTSFIIV